ncbi:MAG: transcription antitermination factor NusB [Ruminococcaceae bacterium]|nr:transcription antitermination factor NusB [Oscillospiraceae bacterium]
MSEMSRKEARRNVFTLLFETEFKKGEDPCLIYASAIEDREIPDDEYMRGVFLGICEKSAELDSIISNYAKGWRADRLSRVSRSVIRLSVYEILYADIPANVSVSEAVELAKKYGEDKSRAFVNGVLASIVRDVEAKGKDALIELGSQNS